MDAGIVIATILLTIVIIFTVQAISDKSIKNLNQAFNRKDLLSES